MKRETRQLLRVKGTTGIALRPDQVLTDARENRLTPENLIASFIASDDTRESSRGLYSVNLGLFFDWVKDTKRDFFKMNRQDILSYKDRLIERGYSPFTINNYLIVVRKFYAWTESFKFYPNIAKGVKGAKRDNTQFQKEHLSDEKSAELLRYFETRSLRDYAIVNLAIRTGLRTIEIIRADVSDITTKTTDKGVFRILKVWGKGRDAKDNYVLLTDKAFDPIQSYLKSRGVVKQNEPLFVSDSDRNRGGRLTTRSISRICKDGLKAIGLDSHSYTAHSLRHTTATAILKHGGSLLDVQTVLRHNSPTTSEIYARSIEKELRLERSPEALIDGAF